MAEKAWKDIVELEWVDAREALVRWADLEERNPSVVVNFRTRAIWVADYCPAATVIRNVLDTGVPGTDVPMTYTIRTDDPERFRQQLRYWLRRIDENPDDFYDCLMREKDGMFLLRRPEDFYARWLGDLIREMEKDLNAATQPSANAKEEYAVLMEMTLRVRFCEEWTPEVIDELRGYHDRLRDPYYSGIVGPIVNHIDEHVSMNLYRLSVQGEAGRPKE